MHDVHPSLGPTDLSHWLPSRKILKISRGQHKIPPLLHCPGLVTLDWLRLPKFWHELYWWLVNKLNVILSLTSCILVSNTNSCYNWLKCRNQFYKKGSLLKTTLLGYITVTAYGMVSNYVWFWLHWWQVHAAPWLWWYKPSSGGWGVKVGRENGSTTCRKSRFTDSLDAYVHQPPTHFCWTNRLNLETQKIQKHHQLMNTSDVLWPFIFCRPLVIRICSKNSAHGRNARCILMEGFQTSTS